MTKAIETLSCSAKTCSRDRVRPSSLKWWRRLTQLTSMAILGQWSFYGIFRCPFLVPYVSCESCPVISCHGRLTTLFWGFWLLLPLSVILFGRAFCGWACPGGFVNQLQGMIAPFKLRFRNTLALLLPHTKYLGLALALYLWLILGQPREAIPIRVGDFFSSVALTFEHANLIWLIRTGIVLCLVLVSFLLANLWCRFACPTGGLLEGLKHFSLYKVYMTEKCNDCDNCLSICEMGTRPGKANCTNCCDCLSSCPQDAIKIGRPGS